MAHVVAFHQNKKLIALHSEDAANRKMAKDANKAKRKR
jgi:hypothetical protein